jgi:hypothetical protein
MAFDPACSTFLACQGSGNGAPDQINAGRLAVLTAVLLLASVPVEQNDAR